MLVRGDLGFPSLVFLVLVVVVVVVVVPVIVFAVRQKWRYAVARKEEIERLLVLASEESSRVEFEAREGYYYIATTTPSSTVSASTSASVPLDSPLKPHHECAVCFCPTTTRCAKCKAVRYCSGKCQIIHWRQGHKDDCRPYVAVSPIKDVTGSSYRQGGGKDHSDSFDMEGQQTATPAEKFTENSHHKDDVGVKSLVHRHAVTFENLETVKSEHQTTVGLARNSAGLGKINQSNSNLSGEDTLSGTSSSSCWTDDGSIKSSSSEPSTTSSGFWGGTIHDKRSTIDELDDFAPPSSGHATNGYMTDHTTKNGYNRTIMNGFNAASIATDGSCLSGLGSKKSNDATNSSKQMFSDGSLLSRASDTHLTSFTSKHVSDSTEPMMVNDDNHRVITCSSQLTKNSLTVRSGLKSSKSKVGDHLRPSKLSQSKGLFSYEMFVKLYNWNKVELHPCGLRNCGNSCYANAVLQCLIYTPPLTAYLLEGLHSKACDKIGWCFMCEFEGLVLKAKNGNSPLSPIRILTHIENMGSNLGHGREEDAHEFLRYVIDALQSVCIKEAGKRAFNSLEEETTLIGLTFGGYLWSKIKCMKCGGKSERYERMMDLTVEIEGDIRTLEEALYKFTCTEILDGENKYKCSRCKSYEKAKKKLTLLEAPNVLTIALKRFQSGKFGKLSKSVKFPEIIDMAPYVSGMGDKSPIYRLYGVVVHIDTMNASYSGHYICYVKNVQNRWFKIDDSMVKEVDLHSVLTKGAYMLLYARCSPRAPHSIRTSSKSTTKPLDASNYRHRSLEDESSFSSSENSGFFSESCSDDYQRNTNFNSSDSDASSTSFFPSPLLYSRLSQLYTSGMNDKVIKEGKKLKCSCNSCSRVTNLGRLGGQATNQTPEPGLTFRRSTVRG